MGYLFFIFTAPALVVSPEVYADQRRGAVMFLAGLWRAADGDALGGDHLKPLWWLLPIQGNGAAIKPQISQTACREKERRKEKQRLYNAKRHTKTTVLGQNLLWTHILHCGRGVNSNEHLQTNVQTHKQPQAKLSAWTSFFEEYFLCWLVGSLCVKQEV